MPATEIIIGGFPPLHINDIDCLVLGVINAIAKGMIEIPLGWYYWATDHAYRGKWQWNSSAWYISISWLHLAAQKEIFGSSQATAASDVWKKLSGFLFKSPIV